MRICRRCGIYAPPEGGVCDGCGADVRGSARDALTVSQRFASVRLEVRCRRCEEWTPVPSVSIERTVGCSRCGADTPFEERWWAKVFDRAHAVADLFGEHPEGREPSGFAIDAVNPFAGVARRRSGIRFAHDEADALEGWLPRELRAWMGPGIPLGPDSFEPLQIRAESPGVLSARTSRGEGARYAVDVRAVGLHRTLLGAIADEHQRDRPEPDVSLERQRGWRCSGCGATFQLDGNLTLVRCDACGLVSHVPAVLRMRAQADPNPDAWWLVFDGVSPYRRFLERHPSTWSEAYEWERPAEASPFAAEGTGGRVVRALYVVGVPTLVLLVVAAMTRLPHLVAWLRAITGG